MHNTARYMVPSGRHRAEQTIERSRFICTIQRVGDAPSAQAFLRELNAEFQDATHNCWAYVAGPPGSTNVIGMSDAGEPHGTAGRPMLTVLLHSGVGEIAAVVTRYYGGTKLVDCFSISGSTDTMLRIAVGPLNGLTGLVVLPDVLHELAA